MQTSKGQWNAVTHSPCPSAKCPTAVLHNGWPCFHLNSPSFGWKRGPKIMLKQKYSHQCLDTSSVYGHVVQTSQGQCSDIIASYTTVKSQQMLVTMMDGHASALTHHCLAGRGPSDHAQAKTAIVKAQSLPVHMDMCCRYQWTSGVL